ncbi:hypothetical protein [Rhodoligotrophos ferricapiens]|uniref:hypothetical protein n=1 Tax=Rhodoligotrophos ferricapiens TaxID=3069264 RepID=UPI00315DDAD8
MMRRFVKNAARSRIIWAFAILSALFWGIWAITSDAFALVFASSLMLGAVVGMAFIFFWVMLRIIRTTNHPDRTDYAIVALAGFMTGTFCTSVWRAVYLVAGRPPAMFQHPAFSFALYVSAVSLLFMGYVWYSDPQLPVTRKRYVVGGSLAIGIIICLMTWWLDLFRFLPFEI